MTVMGTEAGFSLVKSDLPNNRSVFEHSEGVFWLMGRIR